MALDGYSPADLPRQARGAELLSAEVEGALARAWRDHGDKAALGRLVTAHLRLGIALAAKFRRYGAPMADLTQEAALGLMKAAEKFDPDRGVRFSTYASFWIKAQVQDFVLRNHSLVRTGSTSGQKALFFNMARLKAKLVRAAAEEGRVLAGADLAAALAADLGVTLGEVALMEARLSGGDLSLNRPVGGEEAGADWVDLLEDESPGAAETVGARRDGGRVRGWLSQAMGGLSARERRILAARSLADAPRTLESLGAELGLSKERIRQIEGAAHAKLRRALAPHADEIMGVLR